MKSIVKTVANKLIKQKIKISFAESCTGGQLSSKITSISGSSKIFNLGLVTYSDQSKIKILKIPKKTIKKYGAVSKQVCIAMAKKKPNTMYKWYKLHTYGIKLYSNVSKLY